MSRSATDATRFTATAPHAYSKSSSNRSTLPPSIKPGSAPSSAPSSGSSPPLETPAEKVARLRAAHAAKRTTQITTWDRVVVRGRIIADAAHRVTILGLIGLTVVSGGVTLFSLGDMIIRNRRKRKVFYAEQHALLQQSLAEAQDAMARGTATEDQILILNQERAAQEAEEARKSKKGILEAIKGVFSTEGLKLDDVNGNAVALSGEEGPKDLMDESLLLPSANTGFPPKRDVEESSILRAVDLKRRQGEKELQEKGVDGGPLDKTAEDTVSTAKRWWSSWVSK